MSVFVLLGSCFISSFAQGRFDAAVSRWGGGGEERATRRPDEYIDVRFCHFLDLGYRNLMAITLILRSIWLLFIFGLEVR